MSGTHGSILEGGRPTGDDELVGQFRPHVVSRGADPRSSSVVPTFHPRPCSWVSLDPEKILLSVVHSSTLIGIDGYPVQVEVHLTNGLPTFTIVGLPDASCRESRDRVRAAIVTSGFRWPDQRITVNLAPTNLRKTGSALDAAIAIGVLSSSEQLPGGDLSNLGLLGELGLDGTLRPVHGTLPLVHALGDRTPVVPPANHHEATLVRGDAVSARTLGELVTSIQHRTPWYIPDPPVHCGLRSGNSVDLADIQGQTLAKRALEIAAAGNHHILMVGPPGSGKTMLAERVTTLIPDLSEESALEVSRIHSAAGLFDDDDLIRRPPFRAPHHSLSLVALVGGGTSTLRPGEVSLAAGGVLFLDELGEFPVAHLDALRQPLESGRIHISRAMVRAVLPADFLLVAATNPCPCGVGRWGSCSCSQASLTRYNRRLSGPLLDRFDIRIAVDPPDRQRVLTPHNEGSTSNDSRERIERARRCARQRGVAHNRQLGAEDVERFATLTDGARAMLRSLVGDGTITMRGAQRLRLMALTIKDLDGVEGDIGEDDLAEALMLRGQESATRAAG